MKRTDATPRQGVDTRDGGRRAVGVDAVGAPERPPGRTRRHLQRVRQRVAVLVALLILYYATSLHGISSRSLVLALILVLALYWIFKGVL